jgi:phosphate transport system protein
MGSIVEEALEAALRPLHHKEDISSERVLALEDRINSLELELDNCIIDLLALTQPVAGDLRFIIAAQKITNDLERIGDHAVNISESVGTIHSLPEIQIPSEIPRMVVISKTMFKQALDSFILVDTALARTVLETDNQIDDLNRTVSELAIELLKNNTFPIVACLELMRISRNLERVADLATNIAEEVIFASEARIVKHHAFERK